MTDISEFTKQKGQFLSAEDVEDGAKAVIVGEAETIVNKFDTERLHIPVEIDEEEYTFDSSKTNARTIADELDTSETKEWVGAVLELETYKTKTSDGNMTTAINVKSASKENKPKEEKVKE